MRRRLAVLSLLVTLAGCTHPATTDRSNDADVITAAEIEESHAANAYDAIQKLRGNFLSNRGKVTILTSASPLPTVYVDGIEYGGLDQLRNIPAQQVATIRLYRAWASGKYGPNHPAGIIEVTSKQ